MPKQIIVGEEELRVILKHVVREVIAEEFGFLERLPEAIDKLLEILPKERVWFGPGEAEERLKLRKGSLGRKRKQGWFKEGFHYRIANIDPKASELGTRYEYHVDRCRERLSQRRSTWEPYQ